MTNPMLAILGLGPWEIVLILAIVLLLFGTRIPGIMRGLGKGVTEFKAGMREDVDDQSKSPPSDKSAT